MYHGWRQRAMLWFFSVPQESIRRWVQFGPRQIAGIEHWFFEGGSCLLIHKKATARGNEVVGSVDWDNISAADHSKSQVQGLFRGPGQRSTQAWSQFLRCWHHDTRRSFLEDRPWRKPWDDSWQDQGLNSWPIKANPERKRTHRLFHSYWPST